jgi:predicted DsbA family dithiol-disulfide isomerase
VIWRPFEIHPEVPAAGQPLASLGYDPDELAGMMANLRRQAAAEGLDFASRSPASLLANTHRALAASAWAQAEAPARFAAFHDAIFRANFCASRNVGDPAVLRELAAAAGIDPDRMDAALAAGAGETAVQQGARDARRHGITAVPAFVFGAGTVVVGAHPPAALARAAEQAAQEPG